MNPLKNDIVPSPIVKTLLGLPLLTLSFCVNTLAGDWPQWLGPARNGVSDEVIAPWMDQPRIVWRQPLPGGFSTPVVAEGVLFVHASVADQDAEQVVAFNSETGEEIWRSSYPRTPYRSELGSGPRATPSVVDGRLYTMGITGVLSSFDCKTGDPIWQVNPYDELQATRPGFGVCSSPLVVDGKILFSVGGEGSGVVAYDAATGKLVWKILDEPAAAASPVLLIRGDGENRQREVVVQTTLRLLGIDPLDGAIRWEHPLVFQPSGVSPTPLLQDNVLVCSTQDNGTLALGLPASSGETPTVEWWDQDVASYFSTGAVGTDERVYLVTNALAPLPRTDLRCVNARSGQQYWVKQGLGYFHLGVIHLTDGKLLLLDDAGNLVLANGTGDNYQELSKSKVCGGTFVNPVLAQGRVYVRDREQVICLELPTGNDPQTDAATRP